MVEAVLEEGLRRRPPIERVARTGVELPGNGIELALAVDAQVGAFRQVLPDQSIDVLVAPPLPRAVGIGKVRFPSPSCTNAN